MARQSSAALGVVTAVPGQRPQPPAHLDKAAAEVWREVVASKPFDWFTPDNYSLLETYCRTIVESRLTSSALAAHVDRASDEGFARYAALMTLFDKQGRLLAALANRMRLTQQSRMTNDKAATAQKALKTAAPWQRLA